jgi:hypothetical protein
MTGPQTVTANFVAATVNVTVGTSPAGLSFTVDNVTYTSAQMLTWTIGSKHSLSTSTPQTSPGTQYTFNNWSDGGTISHTVTAPGSAATYTAAFSTRYQLITGASPSAGGTVTPSSGAFYAPNTVVNLAAKSEAGYVFSSWTGSVANANNSSTTVTISGPQTVTANFVSALTVSPASINFGTVYLGSIHIQEVTLTNTGTTAITIKEPLFSILQGGNSSEFAEVSLCPASLAAGKQCTIAVSFIAGPFYTPQTAMMYVQDSAPNTPQSVALSATVIDPLALFQPLTLNFGTQKVKTSATQTVKLSNPGATALSIAAMTITGADPGDFKLTPASTCGSSLAPGASCQISVTFTPSASGQRCANLTVTDNALPGSQVVTLVGTGH